MPAVLAAVTDAPIDTAVLEGLVASPRAGAVVTFTGRIRDHDSEASGEVTAIVYTHHPDAGRVMQRLVDAVVADLDPRGEARVAAVHRVGRLHVGDLALAACVATPHRAEAFSLCAELVERIKAEAPIWKQQFNADGSYVWSGLRPAGRSS